MPDGMSVTARIRTANINKGLRDSLLLLNRRKWMIGSIVVVLTGLGFIYTQRLTPRYTAEATVMIDTRNPNVDLETVIPALQIDVAGMRSQTDILHSPYMAKKVIEKLHLADDPIFTSDIKIPDPTADTFASRWIPVLPEWSQQTATNAADYLHLLPAPSSTGTVDNRLEQFQSLVLAKFLKSLEVLNDGRSSTIRLTFESPSPELAAQIVNTIAEAYLDDQMEDKFQKLQRANQWLTDQIAELADKVKKSDSAVQQYEAKYGLTPNAQGSTLSTQQLGDLNTQLVAARADLAQKQSRYNSVAEAAKRGDTGINAPEVLANPLIAQLRQQESTLLQNQKALSERFGEKYYKLIDANSQVEAVRAKIAIEISKITTSLAQDVDAARIRVSELQSGLKSLQGQNTTDTSAQIGLRQLQAEATANRQLQQSMLERQKQTAIEVDLRQPDARIIASADTPLRPTFPNKPLFLIFSTVGASLLAVFLAIARERLDNVYRNPQDIIEDTGLNSSIMIPEISGNKPQDYILTRPNSPFGMSVQSIHTMLRIAASAKKPVKTILVTSSVPSEGKSLLAVSLARSIARANKHVLLVDCDFRRPSVIKMLGGNPKATLMDALNDVVPQDQVVNEDISGMHYIVARANNAPNPSDVFDSEPFKSFLRQASVAYDHVIIDSPPVMASPDASILARNTDATLFVARWGKTMIPTVNNALRQISAAQVTPLHVILSRVTLKQHRRYGLGDQAHYYGQYGRKYDKPA